MHRLQITSPNIPCHFYNNNDCLNYTYHQRIFLNIEYKFMTIYLGFPAMLTEAQLVD